ncbi:cytochrome c3 family protein [Methylomagnum ishizawai]|uniref:cytochrome c3 family protein n=1 Tax=Methylomagnum ishizawai TaxID=1760988 RepID=UPI001C31F7BE|nr:cytochrome c3 family protein [Methylomagnum ishizawai]BBL75809.1 cytochrome c [Methylomagnum ishizawai]
MAQIFHPRADAYARIILGTVLALVLLGASVGLAWVRSPYATGVGAIPRQPVPFSHKHHVGGLGLDCRYCHASVERAASAGMPATETCMTCHSQVWTQAAMLAPVRDSWRTGQPLRWTRVYDLPDFVYFNHSAHIVHGVGCTTCHGPVGEMPLLRQEHSLLMSWCLDCHREPSRQLRPRAAVFDPAWRPVGDPASAGPALARDYRVRGVGLTDCYTCHR